MTTMQATAHLSPALSMLAAALRLANPADGAVGRATERALEHLDTNPAFEFDGVELRVVSQSEADQGVWVVTDGLSCTCKGGKHPMCKHRALFRLLLALEALRDPFYLKIQILEQLAPVADEPPIGAYRVPRAEIETDWYAA